MSDQSLFDEVLAEARQPQEGGIVGALKSWPISTIPVLPRQDLSKLLKWMEGVMQQSPSGMATAAREVPVEDMGIMKWAALNKDGNPVAFYGEDCRRAMLEYAAKNP